jgi:hypothetical protein
VLLNIEKKKKNMLERGLRRITYSLRCAAVAAWPTKKRSRATPFVRFFYGTFLQLLECFAFLYRNCKNVVNFSRYAKFPLNVVKNT